MRKVRIRRPSPAMIVAITALCTSLVGTAFAGPLAEISILKPRDKRIVRKITRKISNRVANRRITKRAPRLSVKRAQLADSATSANSATDAANAANADKLDGLDASEFVGDEQLFVASGPDDAFPEQLLIAFPGLGLELRTTGALSIGYASTAAGNYIWSGYNNGVKVFNAQGPSGAVVANVAFNPAGPNQFAMVRRDPDGSNLGVAIADCFQMPSLAAPDEIACLGRSASG